VQPRTRYARAGDVHVAYQVLGEGPFDLVFVPGILSHIDILWEDPLAARFFRRLASFARLILFDKRGLGLSDRPAGCPTLEERMDDIRAVMDAAHSDSAAIFGVSEGGPLSLLFTASYPERCRALALFGSFARMSRSEDYPIDPNEQVILDTFDDAARHWGEPGLMRLLAPTLWAAGGSRDTWCRFERSAASPGAIRAAIRTNLQIDARHLLPQIRVPTLVVHRSEDRAIPLAAGRYLAERIPGARFVELPGVDHAFWIDPDPILDEIQEFFTGTRVAAETDRVLATVLFTDIVDSTRLAAELGDRHWADFVARHDAATQRQIGRFRGRLVDTAGDGLLATFDGPARAIRCAGAIRQELRGMGVEIRAGLHTGECEVVGEKVSGIAVHIGARVAATAAAGEILVSSTVRDLVAGSGITFEERGVHVLKGVPDEWRLLAVCESPATA
jgi:pimeloyl-ACP methyl ester carboxylesterase